MFAVNGLSVCVVRGLLFVACGLYAVVQCVLIDDRCLYRVDCCALCVVRCLMFVVRCLLPDVCCQLFVGCGCLLFAVYCWLC